MTEQQIKWAMQHDWFVDVLASGEGVLVWYAFRYFEPFVHMQHTKRCVWVIKNCDCFDYQACETDDYRQTVAHRIIAAIRSRAINGLPDYETAPWGIDRG